ncbi:SET domain-containing protein [Basidiobolus meristosporus CBS 931.73]|uniref:SET domain-containing protein n=1 Tax=Basidiobolus meristosporus CBS 931.73 TaxID=1314790 RepID=A0A1Y1Y877_9FUNG|nr:SET domain-containing protein [Basidiobolus meristosporus CBS 931.73]|eukprot:ORX94230.1 SET domain-containing protein [Basidiobolus meristosporus CBS 931.73]
MVIGMLAVISHLLLVRGDKPINVNSELSLFKPGLYHNDAYVYRRYHMPDFQDAFNITPVNHMVVDKEIEEWITGATPFDFMENEDDIEEIMENVEVFSEYAEIIKDHNDDERLYVRWINDIIKWGLFTCELIPEGTIVGLYTGLLTNNTLDGAYAWQYSYLDSVVVDKDSYQVDLSVDSLNVGNYLRFANHNTKLQNAQSMYSVHDNLWHIFYVALRDILPNEEIFVDYGDQYWSDGRVLLQ